MKFLILLFIIVALPVSIHAQSSYKFYQYGQLEIWQQQHDVFAFELDDLQAWVDTPNIDTSLVANIQRAGSYARKRLSVCFHPWVSVNQMQGQIQAIRNHPNFIREFPAVSPVAGSNWEDGMWLEATDRILVAFSDPSISLAKVEAFAQRHCLDVVHKPGAALPKGSWAYIFELNSAAREVCNYTNTFDAAKALWELDKQILKWAEPEFLDYSMEFPIPGLPSSSPVCGVVDEHGPDMWQLDYFGAELGSGMFGTGDPSADICECWDDGYTGRFVRVGVLDYHGFDFSDPDLQLAYRPGWNCVADTTMPTTIILDSAAGHGHSMSSVIAAEAGNWYGVAGVARHARIVPLLRDHSSGSAVIGYQKALELNVDVLNMSFASNTITQGVQDHLEELYLDGRPILGGSSRGMVLVASAGNNNMHSSPQYPAGLDFVIGVAATNPLDERGESNDGWGTFLNNSGIGAGGSNYGPYYEVSAPGRRIYANDLPGVLGYFDNPDVHSGYWSGTSVAAAVVSGACAILLDKNPDLTADEIRQTLIDGAEKVGGYDYQAFPQDPGRSNELQYGRVSCIASLSSVPVGYTEMVDAPIDIVVKGSSLEISGARGGVVEIYNFLGQLVFTEDLSNHSFSQHVNLDGIAVGIYVVTVRLDRLSVRQKFFVH